MSLRLKILLLTVPAVLCLVAGFAALLLRNLIESNLRSSRALAEIALQQTKEALLTRLDEAARQGAAGREKWTDAIASDPRLAQFLVGGVANAPSLVEISIASSDGAILLSSTQSAQRNLRPQPPLDQLLALDTWGRLNRLMARSQDYELRIPIGLLDDPVPLFQIQVLVSTTLVKEQIMGGLRSIGFAAAVALGVLLLGVSLLAGLVGRNLRQIERSIELIRQGEPAESGPQAASTPEFAAVQSKLNLLGAEVRDTARTAADFRTRVSEVLERLEEGILLFDAEGRLVLSGGAAERMLGRALSGFEAKGTPLESLLKEAFRTRAGVPERLTEWPRAEGPVSLHAAADFLSESRCLVRLRDAEGRRHLESQLELLARLDGINRLTGGVAHEIKNPLNSIAAHLALLSAATPDDEDAIRVIGEEVDRLDRVVRTFLDFTRPVELARARVDLGALAGEVARLVQPDAARKGIAVETRFDPPGPWIWGDEDILRQALMNLAVNAIEAMPDGGTLSVDLAPRGGSVELAVGDTGTGIPREKLGRIFQLYFTTKKGGSGVGLAMVYRAVQLHGGTITVDSEPGKGTRFLLMFPALAES